MTDYALKGDILYAESPDRIAVRPQSYLVCRGGVSAGVFPVLPGALEGLPVMDCKEALILPGLCDLHVHAPQYTFRGTGMDLELIDWLNTYTFPEEAKYSDLEYAQAAYRIFAEDLRKSPTTRACVFATVHTQATLRLMELLEASGVRAMVGKVNMDRNCPDPLREQGAAASLEETRRWLEDCAGRFSRVTPILTPRFIPSCSDELMEGLGELQRATGLPLQSHLSENRSEIAWVKELCPDCACYGGAYDRFGLFGGACHTVMAHCIHPSGEELALMEARGIYVAHCPQANMNLASGAAPVRTYLEHGIPVGLGSDIAGGSSLSIFTAMTEAIQLSKLYWRYVDEDARPLTLSEAFYLGTKGGGAFFGKVGGFEEGYAFDALVLDDHVLATPLTLTPLQRLERMVYLYEPDMLKAKIVEGSFLKLR